MLIFLLSHLYTAVIVVLFFGLTIFIHELGHYLVARWCGLKVKTFSIGFGPAIWKREVNGILYKIGCLPLGGYVALPQLDPEAMATLQGKEGEDGEVLPPVAPWRKILVSLAGATGNVLLAFVLAWLVFWRGMPATLANQETLLGFVDPASSLYEQGVRIGDRIVAVNATTVSTWSQFVQESTMHEAVTLVVEQPDGGKLTVQVPTVSWRYGVRMVSGVEPIEMVSVDAAESEYPAAAAGVQPGDEILSFAGETVLSRAHLIDLVQQTGESPQTMVVRRAGPDGQQELTMQMGAIYDDALDMMRIGIRFQQPEQQLDKASRVYPAPMAQIRLHASGIFRFLRDLATPRKSARAANMVGGPVAIITYYFGMVQASFMLAVWFTGFLNINLAIINLLPLPVLDGGHILFALWEWVFRRPVRPGVIHALTNIFMVLLLGLFLLLSFRDVDRHTPAGRAIRGILRQDPTESPATTDAREGLPAAEPSDAEVPGYE